MCWERYLDHEDLQTTNQPKPALKQAPPAPEPEAQPEETLQPVEALPA